MRFSEVVMATISHFTGPSLEINYSLRHVNRITFGKALYGAFHIGRTCMVVVPDEVGELSLETLIT